MPTVRKFKFGLPILIREGKAILDAAAKYAAPLAQRLPAQRLAELQALHTTVETSSVAKREKAGQVGEMTEAQNDRIRDLREIMNKAREFAKRTFAGQEVKLREQFQVGSHKNNDLASVEQRARIILASCKEATNATALATKGWLASDTQQLEAVIVAFFVAVTPTHVDACITGSVFIYYHGDHLGSSNVITDRNGVQADHYEYFAFGKDRYNPGCSFQPSNKFTGQIKDDDTGLYYYNARYYDPELGRFIQPDTIVPSADDPQTLNRYSYVRNNPLLYVDPTGHSELYNAERDQNTSGPVGRDSNNNRKGKGLTPGGLGPTLGPDSTPRSDAAIIWYNSNSRHSNNKSLEVKKHLSRASRFKIVRPHRTRRIDNHLNPESLRLGAALATQPLDQTQTLPQLVLV